MTMTEASPYRYDPAAFRDVFEHHFTYLSGFWRNVHRYASRPALHDPLTGRRWTYAELGRDVEQLAGGLAACGVGRGDVVVFQLFNTPEWALLYLAAQHLGAVGSPVNFRFSSGETAYVLDDARPAAYVYDVALTDTARAAVDSARHRPGALVAVAADGSGTPPLPGAISFGELLASGRPVTVPPSAVSVYDETTRLYTSGTTGMPKGVSLSSLVEVLTAHDVIMHFPLSPEDKTLNMTPWFHRGGVSSGGPEPVFYTGAEAVAMPRFDPDLCLDYVTAHGITFLIGAPTNLVMLADAQEARPRDLSSLRGIVTMGAPLERQACLRFQQVLTPRIFNGYGTTEAFWNTFLRPADLPDHAGTAGRACTDDDVAVVRVGDGNAAGPDDLAAKDNTEIGEVIVRSVKSGYAYANNPAEQAQRFRGGWLYTGDLATWDSDEYVTIVGRKDDMIISGGENVHPAQVEEVLNEHPRVRDCAVVGLPDPRWGELVVAYIVAADDDGLTAAECDKHCQAHPMLATYKRPRAYRFVPGLPVTATGKKMHYKVREMAIEDEAAGLLARP
jgi:acyl-CoA synthetase (AMP-forming)/AMP-acid ligase II